MHNVGDAISNIGASGHRGANWHGLIAVIDFPLGVDACDTPLVRFMHSRRTYGLSNVNQLSWSVSVFNVFGEG